MRRVVGRVIVGFLVLAASLAHAAEPGLDKLLEAFRRGNAGAKQRVIDAGVPAIAPLCALMAHRDARVASEARSALRWIAVHAADPATSADQRTAVRDALAPRIVMGKPVVRRAAIEALGLVGTDLDVPPLADLLADKALAHQAAEALSRIWGHAGKGALIDALAKPARPALKAHVLALIASHREADTVPLFVAAAADKHEAVAVAAVLAIGLLADPKGEPSLLQAIQQGAPSVRPVAFDSLLAIAATRLIAGDGPAARALYERSLDLATTGRQRSAALAGIGRVGDAASLPKLVACLRAHSPVVRHTAYAALCQVHGPAGTQAIAAALPNAPNTLKPMLIAALGTRRHPATATQFLGLAKNPDAPIALAAVHALGQLGDPAAATSLLEVAESPAPDAVKAAALRVALALGHTLADRGQGPAALAVFQRAFPLARHDADRAEAIHGLGAVGDPRALAILRPILADPKSTLRDAALEATLGIADAVMGRGDRDKAIVILKMIADLEAADRFVQEATKKLQTLGVHTSLAAHEGAVASWWVIGPFDCRNFNDAKKPRFPEREVKLKKVYTVAGRTLRWKLHHSRHAKGWVDLNPLFKPNDKVLAYAYTELAMPDEQQVELHLGRDDGLALWLNGTQLYDEHGPHSAATEDFVVKATLVQGINTLLVKSSEGSGAWEFYVRITDTEGKPLDHTKK